MIVEDLREARRADRRRRWLPVAAAVAVPALALFIGVDLAHALLLGGGVVAATLLSRMLPFGTRATWPVLPYGRREGVRRDVSSLTWTMLDRDGRISSSGEPRLRAVLTSALELRRMPLTTPTGRERAAELVGADVAEWLATGDPPAPPPSAVLRTIALVRPAQAAPPAHAVPPAQRKATRD